MADAQRPTALSARQLAFLTLRSIEKGAFADVELDRRLRKSALSKLDRRLATELVYGSVRRQRTLDALIDQLGKKPAAQQALDLRLALRLGLYQLRYLDQVPDHAVVSTTVNLAKQNRLGKLSGVVNGMLRQYIRLSDNGQDPLQLPSDPVQALAIAYSFPDWIIQNWQALLPADEVEALCDWFNRAPVIDLRVNRLRASVGRVETALSEAGIAVDRLLGVPDALRLREHVGNLRQLPGYTEGWWSVQDSSAQRVSSLVDPQPGELIVDACAAPGGKAAHLAELMGDQGVVLACDRTPQKIRKIEQNIQRLQLKSVQTRLGDSRSQADLAGKADRVLLDVPCSGLGTLHRHADARWRQTPETVAGLVTLQAELLEQAATWVKPGGVLVYSTCTLQPDENENQIHAFLAHHSDWQIAPPGTGSPLASLPQDETGIRIWPHRQDSDGFYMVRLEKAH
ncbi:MAG: 16S rRNA (cytosine(967)-C(5))-methyltransferase [Cyanobacteria bacterium J06628_6]